MGDLERRIDDLERRAGVDGEPDHVIVIRRRGVELPDDWEAMTDDELKARHVVVLRFAAQPKS